MGKRKFKFEGPHGMKMIAVKADEALKLFLDSLDDEVPIARAWAQETTVEIMTELYEAFLDTASRKGEEYEMSAGSVVVILVAVAAAVANAGGFNKAALLKAVYDLPWPSTFDPDAEKCQQCSKYDECKEDRNDGDSEGFAEMLKCNVLPAKGMN